MLRNSSSLAALVDQRVTSLVNDGYCLRFHSVVHGNTHVVLLMHPNGNTVRLFAYVAIDFMKQFSNGRLVYSGRITA